MAGSRCAMCGFPIAAENECNVTCEGPCRKMFHVACVVGSSIGSWVPNSKHHWKCCSCRSLVTSELASSALKSAFLPVKNAVESPQNALENVRKPQKPRSTDSPNMDNLTNAVEFLGGQIDIFNRIVCKFKKRMDEFEKLNRELKDENEELKITVQALRKRVEAVENDQIFGQCHLNSSTDEMNYSSGSGSFDFPEIAPGIFVLPESVAEDLEVLQLANPEVLQTAGNGELKVKFEIAGTSPLGFEVPEDSGSDEHDLLPEMTSDLVPGTVVLPGSIPDFGALRPETGTPEARQTGDQEKLRVRFELPPPSPLGFDVREDSGSIQEAFPGMTPGLDDASDPASVPTIVVVPPGVQRKLRSALKPARKHFGNVVVRLMAEEYLSGNNE